MKRDVKVVLSVLLVSFLIILMLSIPLASASWFSDLWNWLTGKKVVQMAPVQGDFNNDGRVDNADVTFLSSCFGSHTGDSKWSQCSIGDLNNDGAVDVKDIAILARLVSAPVNVTPSVNVTPASVNVTPTPAPTPVNATCSYSSVSEGETASVQTSAGSYNVAVDAVDYSTSAAITVNGVSQKVNIGGAYKIAGAYVTILDITYSTKVGAINKVSFGIGTSDYCVSPSPTTTCTDSDGGINYNVKGTLIGYDEDGKVTETDVCTGNKPGYSMLEYYCYPTNASDWSPGAFTSIGYDCPYGCSDGACLKAPVVKVLSPNGGETFTQGTPNLIKLTGGQKIVQVGLVKADFDFKNVSKLLGWISLNSSPNISVSWDGRYITDLSGNAKWNVAPGSYKIISVSESSAGYCMNPTEGCNVDISDAPFNIVALSPTCTDSDGGINYNVKGTTIGTYEPNPTVKSSSDYCLNPSPENDNNLLEFYCKGGSNFTGAYYKCPNGCKDGACLAAPTNVTNRYPDILIEKDISNISNFVYVGSSYQKETEGGVQNIDRYEAKYSFNSKWVSNKSYVEASVIVLKFDSKDSLGQFMKYQALNNNLALLTWVNGQFTYTFTNNVNDTITMWTNQNLIVVAVRGALVSGLASAGGTGLFNAELINAYLARYPSNVAALTCTDSDGGRNYYVKGTATSNFGVSKTDVCEFRTATIGGVTEYYCTSWGTIGVESVTCPGNMGCSDGACLKAPSRTCNDSDGGKNYGVKGTLVGWGGDGKQYTMSDACTGNKPGYSMLEYYCLPGSQGTFTSAGYNCPYGCSNGACVAGSKLQCKNTYFKSYHFGGCKPTACSPDSYVRCQTAMFGRSSETCTKTYTTACSASPACNAGDALVSKTAC